MPSARPRIGITAWRRPLPTPLGERTDLYTLGVEYAAAVETAGGLPLILPHSGDAESILDALDGLLLSGGGDVDPASYGAVAVAAKDQAAAADQWELALVRGARARDLPVLGICRGMQVLAVAYGGHLEQDVAGRDGHPDMGPMTPDEVLGARHAVAIAPGSTLARLYGTTRRQVNTIHHQAVADAGALVVAARDDGGMIEAVEGRGPACVLGVQWHPEKLAPGEMAAERPLFDHLVAEAAAYAARRRPEER
ncbi:MAG: gamma-glutamyl-gamma-aminobutyrate hydrolase family protein [Vicinamibacterales bacterium]